MIQLLFIFLLLALTVAFAAVQEGFISGCKLFNTCQSCNNSKNYEIDVNLASSNPLPWSHEYSIENCAWYRGKCMDCIGSKCANLRKKRCKTM